jgi:hypothetical protein
MVCGCSGRTGPRGLASEDSAEKIPAIKQAGDRRDKRVVPQLVKELSNDDPAVRFYAIEALERITGQTLDYRYFDDYEKRQPAIVRWQNWLKTHAIDAK